MAGEYNRALRRALSEAVGLGGVVGALFGRRGGLDRDRLGYALLQAERLCAMLAHTRAAEALVRSASGDAGRRRLAERYVHRNLPLVRMHGEIVRGGDRSTLEAIAS
jgi:hypothetical protein